MDFLTGAIDSVTAGVSLFFFRGIDVGKRAVGGLVNAANGDLELDGDSLESSILVSIGKLVDPGATLGKPTGRPGWPELRS